MARILLVGQETGGIGKSTVVRGLAEAVPDAQILEIESVHRLTEFKTGKANEPGRVRHFEMRATREAIEASGGKAARAELDDVINALHMVKAASLVDIGANTSASLLGILKEEASTLREAGIELGLVVVVAAEAGALAEEVSYCTWPKTGQAPVSSWPMPCGARSTRSCSSGWRATRRSRICATSTWRRRPARCWPRASSAGSPSSTGRA
ncbi:hypothetical protein ACFQFG_02030 [Methylobacterium persicinum]